MDENRVFTELEMQEYQAAFQQEFQERQASKEKPIHKIEELEEPSLEAIASTIRFSQNESLRTRTAQWVLDKLLDNSYREEDKVLDFLKGLPTDTEVTR